jgi:hypothetical protein
MKNIKRTLRKWHKWTGVIIAIAFGIVGITTFFLAHGKGLGLDETFVNASWLPGYKTYATRMEQETVKYCLSTREGEWLVGTKSGLFVVTQGKLTPVNSLLGVEVRCIVKNKNNLLVGSKNGVWVFQGNSWKRIYEEDVHSVSISDNGEIILATVHNGLRVSNDGGSNWAELLSLSTTFSTLQFPRIKQKISLHKLMGDLHTGKAFFGKSLEWVWIDILGLTVIFLTATGVYLWWK